MQKQRQTLHIRNPILDVAPYHLQHLHIDIGVKALSPLPILREIRLRKASAIAAALPHDQPDVYKLFPRNVRHIPQQEKLVWFPLSHHLTQCHLTKNKTSSSISSILHPRRKRPSR